MKTELPEQSKTSINTQDADISFVSMRKWLFEAWYAGEKFEHIIEARDRESAIIHFEIQFPNHRWYATTEK